LETREVTTLAGTGIRGEDPKTNNDNMMQQNLTTPFDIVYDKDIHSFYIAMSGIHQIWKLDLEANTIKPFSGNGVEGCHDDQTNLMNCTWAQPSGVAFGPGQDGKKELYVADSESSAVRCIDLDDLKSARTVVGGDGTSTNLFSYGDVDGVGIEAKLQHPVGLDYIDPLKKVLLLDSYNHKIKLCDPEANNIETILGDGVGGLKDGSGLKCQFMEPTDS